MIQRKTKFVDELKLKYLIVTSLGLMSYKQWNLQRIKKSHIEE